MNLTTSQDQRRPRRRVIGSAIVTGTHPFVGVVDEVKYVGDDLDTGHDMSYMITNDLAEAGGSLALPLAQRGVLATGMGDTSGVQTFNPTNDSVEVEIYSITSFGSIVVGETEVNLGPKESYTFYMFSVNGILDDFQGSLMVYV